eukprot:TRINITY_DN23311_c0_g1_i1.p1 TRINITY_DN23311_c0_g1~~TRINITY_DN23311_c0_g1_i1.p1  ORF type:complete len:142 (-),score=27.76 TRINITY_DN23311_c0_g1_i1:111-536(-)
MSSSFRHKPIKAKVEEHCNLNSPHGNFIIVRVEKNDLVLSETGHGVDTLKDHLKDDEVCFALLTLRLTLEDVPDQPRNIFMHWKGPKAPGKVKVNVGTHAQDAISALSPNHGQLEVVGKTNFNEYDIGTKWHPKAGSHVID